MHSTERRLNSNDWCVDYFTRRIFRIAPLFYSVLAFELSRQILSGGLQSSIPNLILNLSFTTGFSPFTEIVWGGWSIGVEMIFYALFPAILLTARTHCIALVMTLISIVVSYSLRHSMNVDFFTNKPASGMNWSYFAFAPNFCFFMMGIYAYRATTSIEKTFLTAKIIMPTIAISMIISLAFLGLGARSKDGGSLDIILWGIGFTALTIWQGINPSKIISSKPLEFLGERSFSIYLLHPIIIYYSKDRLGELYTYTSQYIGSYSFFLCAAISLVVIFLAAELTYRLIETPGINLGRKLIKARQNNNNLNLGLRPKALTK